MTLFHGKLVQRQPGNNGLRRRYRGPSAPRRRFLPGVDLMEDRLVPTNYSAANVSALIADISASNAAGGANTISLTAPTTSPYQFTSANNATNGYNFLPVIAVNDNLTIIGNGDTLEPAPRGGEFRFFDVTAGASLTLENLTLEGDGRSFNGEGGAIYDQGVLTLSDVTVQRFELEPLVGSAMGGAIWSSGSLTLENGTLLEDNTVTGENGGYDGFGGAVYIGGGSAKISNTTFTGNVATGGLGALPVDDGSGLGGAIYVTAAEAVMITTSTLENNEANVAFNEAGNSYGGGLYVVGNTVTPVTLSNDTVESNSASFGGGLYFAGGTVTLSNDTVESNSASSAGGGICYSAEYAGSGTMTLSNDTVESNSASSGGGLYVAGVTVTLSNDTVESNSASSAGGGIYIATAATVSIDPFTLAHVINNTASTDPNIDGTYIET
jgi:hypothetical protein